MRFLGLGSTPLLSEFQRKSWRVWEVVANVAVEVVMMKIMEMVAKGIGIS